MKFLRYPALTWTCAIGLGAFFLYACVHKISDPPDFAKSVNDYKVLESAFINAVAIYMPWLELFCGLALVTSLGRRGAAFITGGLLVLFIVLLSYNLYRGHPTVCGCTLTFQEAQNFTDADKFWEMKKAIARDVGLLILALQVWFSGCCVKQD